MKKKPLYVVIGIVGIIILFVLFSKEKKAERDLFYTAQRGSIEIKVVVSGEIQSENSEIISLPAALLNGRVRVYDIKLTDIVPEGTFVNEGDFVAALDHSAVMTQINASKTKLDERLAQLEQTKLDTTLDMMNIRNDLQVASENVEEQKIAVEQTVYESPAVQRQAKLDYDKAVRDFIQKKLNLKLQILKARQKVSQQINEVENAKEEISDLEIIFNSLNITAPRTGMVIYTRQYDGQKLKAGSTVNRWNPRIAELPDMSSLISRVYVNEVDISKVKKGQPVLVSIDALPKMQFNGNVISVSNMGQDIPGKNIKAFECIVKIDGVDKQLKPLMTSNNVISCGIVENVIVAPIEALFQTDSIQYVFKKGSAKKFVVEPGVENEAFVEIKSGVTAGDVLYLTKPEHSDEWPIEGFNSKTGKQ